VTNSCLVRDMTISGAALDVADPHDIPERFNLVFKADGTHIPCHVVWRQEERITQVEISALDRRSFRPTLSVPIESHSVPNLYRLRINYGQKIRGLSFEPKPPSAVGECLSYPKATIRHFD
jgi:hypothetical protein